MTERRTDRDEPVGEPVVRADPDVAGERADDAVRFDPDDPDSVAEAAAVVREFAAAGPGDRLVTLRGAAACAALVRGVGSYKAAADRAGDVSVAFIRKWARVHDLPIAVRRHVARGDVVPSAAKHIARVDGEARFLLAWATIDADLTVREVRAVVSAIDEGRSVEEALRDRGLTPGELTVTLPKTAYVELRRRASNANRTPGDVVADLLSAAPDD